MRLDRFRKLLAAVVVHVGLLAGPAQAANNWENGFTLYQNTCTGCHNPNPTLAGSIGPAVAGMTATDITNAIATVPAMQSLSLTADQISDIGAYLSAHLTFPRASLAAVTSTAFPAVSAGLTSGPLLFRLSNTGTATLTTSGAGLVFDSTNFLLNNPGACASVTAGSSCDFSVTFRPQSVGSFGTTLRVNGLNTFAGTVSINLSGEGQRPFDVSATLLAWPPNTEPTGALTTITDRKGDRVQVCRLDAASFSHPEDFSIDAPNALGADNCFTSDTSATTATANRLFNLRVHFAPPPERANKPSFATLRVRRVDASGNPLSGTDVVNVSLQGNPGALATVTEMTLFDHAGDPGVEVDNDHFVDRSFTVTSEGTQPLTFAAGTFGIGGSFPADYAVLPDGCLARSGLDAADTPGGVTSCVVTVRFNPADAGLRDARLTIQISGATDNRVDLNGTGFRGARLAVRRNGLALASESLLEFGAKTIGGLFEPITVTLANGGTQGVLGVALPAAGSIPGFSFVADPGCAAIAAGAQCNVAISFKPSAIGDASGRFVIALSGGSDPLPDFALNLHGQGTTFQVPVLSWTDTTGTAITRLDFPVTDIGSPSPAQVRLSNAGPGGVALQFANVVGSDAGNFIVDPGSCSAGSTLFEGMSCALTISFAPGTPGTKAASLQLATSAGEPPMLVLPPLLVASGTGRGAATPGTLQLSPAALQFSDTAVGSQGVRQEVRLSNGGVHDLVVQALEASAPFSVQSKTCGSAPFVLRAGTECSVTIEFAPQAQGSASGTLRITTDASATPTELALSANATPPADVSGGGCTLARGDSLADPTLLLLLLGAGVVLIVRRRRSAQ